MNNASTIFLYLPKTEKVLFWLIIFFLNVSARQSRSKNLSRVTEISSIKCLWLDLNSDPPDSGAGTLSTVPPSCHLAY